MNAKDKLATGRLMACNKFRYFRTALMALVPKPVEGLGTFGVTDDGVLMWDPKMAQEWTVEEIAAVLIHEVSHLLRGHAKRRKRFENAADFDAQKWNQAADYEINDDLYDAKLKLPVFKVNGVEVDKPCIPQLNKLPTGLTAEEYLRLIKDPPKQKGPPGAQGQGQKPHVGCGWCGGGAGRPLPGEPQAKAQSKGRSDVELERIKRTVAEEIRKEMHKSQGRVPGGWQRWAEEELTPPKVRWQDKLQRITRGSIAYRPGAVDYHYSKPSRRQPGLGWGVGVPILPALRAPQPKVAVVQDTSGSMSAEDLSACLPEVDAILKQTGSRVTFVACDAAVHELKQVRHWKELLPLMKGGGGTDFRPAFEALAAQRERPDVVVFATDGFGTFPEEAPPFKVVWLLTGNHLEVERVPFGEVVEIDENRD